MFCYSEITLIRNKFQSLNSSKKKKNKSNQKDTSVSKNSNSIDKECEIKEQLLLIFGSLDPEQCCTSSKAVRRLAYRLLFMQKIKDFCESDESLRELKFHIVLNRKQRTYIQAVVTNIYKPNVKNVYNSFLENDLFKKIRKDCNCCHMSVVFSGR